MAIGMNTRTRSMRGGSSILAVFFVMLFSVLSLSFVSMSNTNIQMARSHRDVAMAQAAAESGIEYARWLVNDYLDYYEPYTFNAIYTDAEKIALFQEMIVYIQSSLNDTLSVEGGQWITTGCFYDDSRQGLQLNIPLVKLSSSDSLEQFSLRFRQYSDDVDNVEIVCEGKTSNVIRKIGLTFAIKKDLPHMFDYAIYTKDSLALSSGVSVYGYNIDPGEPPLKIGTNSTMDGAIQLNHCTIVDGDVEVGPGGDPDSVIYMGDGSNIMGDKLVMPEEWVPPAVEVPSALNNSPSQGMLTAGTTLTTGGKYDGISLPKGQTIVIDGPVELYVTGDINLVQLAGIQINTANPDASLKLFLGGNFHGDRAAFLNNGTNDASRLMILGLETCESFELDNSGTVCASIYVPYAQSNFNNLVELNGAIACANFVQNQGVDFYYDAALRDVNTGGVQSFILIVPDVNSYVEY